MSVTLIQQLQYHTFRDGPALYFAEIFGRSNS